MSGRIECDRLHVCARVAPESLLFFTDIFHVLYHHSPEHHSYSRPLLRGLPRAFQSDISALPGACLYDDLHRLRTGSTGIDKRGNIGVPFATDIH